MKQKLIRKLRTKSFWVQLAGAVVLLLGLFGVKIDGPYAGEITEALCSLLIILGLITSPAPAAKDESAEETGGGDDEAAENQEGTAACGSIADGAAGKASAKTAPDAFQVGKLPPK